MSRNDTMVNINEVDYNVGHSYTGYLVDVTNYKNPEDYDELSLDSDEEYENKFEKDKLYIDTENDKKDDKDYL